MWDGAAVAGNGCRLGLEVPGSLGGGKTQK